MNLISSLSIRTKIVLGTGLVALASWMLLAGFSYALTGMLLAASSKRMFESASSAVSAEIRNTYEPVERTTSLLAHSRLLDARDVAERLRQVPVLAEILRETRASAGIQLGDEHGNYFIVRALGSSNAKHFDAPEKSAYEADFIDGSTRRFHRWFYDDQLRLLGSRNLGLSDYDPRTRPWYLLAMGASKAVATAPYVFYFMSEIGVTVGQADASRRSVVATDVTLASLSRVLASHRLSPSSEVLLQDARGVIAWSGAANALIGEIDGTLRRRRMGELEHAALTQLAKGTSPEGWLVHRSPLGLAGDESSELVILVPEADVLADVRHARDWVLFVSFIALALVVPLTWILANRISTPLRELHDAIGRVGIGSFDFWLPDVRSRDEVGDLNLALRTMRASLKQSAEELTAATAARERLESELDIARRIQMGFVPGGGTLSRASANAALYARLIPARAVGGDLYEVMDLQDGRLFVAVGDVSDKGIHAALLMSRVITLAKLLVPGTRGLAALLSELNAQLSEGNAECMFVTLFCAIVDLRSGEVRYASAGHNPPLVSRAGGVSALPVESGAPLGLHGGATYVESSFYVAAGERLVIYTDGVTEAFDEGRHEFGEGRLIALLQRAGREENAADLGERILREVSSFAGAAPQSDDITLLILHRT